MSVLNRNAVTVCGSGEKPMVFLHGFACDQHIWRRIYPHFEADHKIVLFDHVGSGKSDTRAYDKMRYAYLQAYADDFIEICDELNLRDIEVVAHSVGCMIAILAAKQRPELFSRLMLLGPSPCYIDQDGYVGGFTREGVDELLAFLEINYAGWAASLAPMVMANAERPELAEELEAQFLRNNPDILHHFAGVIFRSDHRADLAGVTTPTLIMQCSDDIVAPLEVGEFMHNALPASSLIVLATHGHYPQMSDPNEVSRALIAYVGGSAKLAA